MRLDGNPDIRFTACHNFAEQITGVALFYFNPFGITADDFHPGLFNDSFQLHNKRSSSSLKSLSVMEVAGRFSFNPRPLSNYSIFGFWYFENVILYNREKRG